MAPGAAGREEVSMDLTWRDQFLTQWRRFFGGEELPLTFYDTDEEG